MVNVPNYVKPEIVLSDSASTVIQHIKYFVGDDPNPTSNHTTQSAYDVDE
jgi:hypothetical protein